MSKENKLIPELRFPEFKNNGNWTEKRLADFNDLQSGDGDWILSKDISSNGDYEIVQLSSIGFGGFKEKTLKTISDETFKELNGTPIQKGDLLINRMVDSNKINSCIFPYDGKYVTSVDVCWIRQNQSFNNYFLMSLLCTGSNQRNLLSLSSGAGRVRISKKNLFEKFVFLFPLNPKEQQKIASCLSSLDELIAAHNDKLEALKDHKKGLMQSLFPKEGEKVPKFRFPEFEKDGEWVVKRLGEVFQSFSGGTPNTSEKKYYGGNIPFIRSAEIAKSSTELFLTEEGLNNSSAKQVNKGDLLVALYGANSGDVAISKIDGAINQAILCLRSDFSNSFTHQYMALKKKWIISKYIQGGQGNLSGNIIKLVELLFPKKEEQQKIAFCLSALDELITAQSEKIEQLKEHKKGLMQGLFPKIDN